MATLFVQNNTTKQTERKHLVKDIDENNIV